MWALFTFRLVYLLEDEARISLPGLVTITKDPVHCVCLGLIGESMMSNVDKLGLAKSMMTISVEIRSSNLVFVMMTTTVAMNSLIFRGNYYSINACSSACRGARTAGLTVVGC